MCLLVKKDPDSYANRFTQAVIAIPYGALHPLDVDEDGNVSSESCWFRTVSIADIDLVRTFSDDEYKGFQTPSDFILARNMFWKLVEAVDPHGGSQPRWMTRGLNPNYIVTFDSSVVIKEAEEPRPLLMDSDPDEQKRKRKKTKTYNPQEILEEEVSKRGKKGTRQVITTTTSKKPVRGKSRRSSADFVYETDWVDEFEEPAVHVLTKGTFVFKRVYM